MTPGQRSDIAFAHQRVEGFAAGVTIADKGYDADPEHTQRTSVAGKFDDNFLELIDALLVAF